MGEIIKQEALKVAMFILGENASDEELARASNKILEFAEWYSDEAVGLPDPWH